MRNIAVKLTTTVFSAGVLLLTAFTIKSSDRLEGLESKITGLIEAMTLEEKISMIHANSKFTIAGVERLGINEMTMSDGPHGVRYEIERHSWNSAGRTDDYATYLPHLTSVAASWDTKMAQLHGQVLGAEARDRGKDFILGPGVNLARLPLYGRNFEYMGEGFALSVEDKASLTIRFLTVLSSSVSFFAFSFSVNSLGTISRSSTFTPAFAK